MHRVALTYYENDAPSGVLLRLLVWDDGQRERLTSPDNFNYVRNGSVFDWLDSGSFLLNYYRFVESALDFTLTDLATLLPARIESGSILPYWDYLSSGVEPPSWTADRDYVLVEGWSTAYVVPVVSRGYFVGGLTVRYAEDLERYHIPDIQDYWPAYTGRSSLMWMLPRVWSNDVLQVAANEWIYQGGAWHCVQTWVGTSFLWGYPPVSEEYDIRQCVSDEEHELSFVLGDVLKDKTDRGLSGISILPDPAGGSGITRRWPSARGWVDEIGVQSGLIYFYSSAVGQSGGGKSVPFPLLVRLGHSGGGGASGSWGLGSASRPLSILSQLVTIGGAQVNIKSVRERV